MDRLGMRKVATLNFLRVGARIDFIACTRLADFALKRRVVLSIALGIELRLKCLIPLVIARRVW